MIVNGHQIHVETAGPEDGEAVVLLHHGLGSVRAWKGQIPALIKAGFRTIAYDRWGYGGSDLRTDLLTSGFEAEQDELLDLLNKLGIQRAHLVGHSDGGTISLYFAAERPERVTSLVVAAAHIYFEPKMELGIQGVRQMFEKQPAFHEALGYVHGDKVDQVFKNWYEGWFTEDNRHWDMRPVLHKVRCPTLVVQGTEDEHATPQHAKDLAAAIPGAQAWLLPGAKHMLPQEEAEIFNKRILEFLNLHI